MFLLFSLIHFLFIWYLSEDSSAETYLFSLSLLLDSCGKQVNWCTMAIAHIKHCTSYRMFMSVCKINRHKIHTQTLYVLRERERMRRMVILSHIEQIMSMTIALLLWWTEEGTRETERERERERERKLTKSIDVNETKSAFYYLLFKCSRK